MSLFNWNRAPVADDCFDVPELSKEQAFAVKALWAGEAEPHQQRIALHAITNCFCRTQYNLFIPGKPDETAFLAGRAFAGAQILKILKVPIGQLRLQKEAPEE